MGGMQIAPFTAVSGGAAATTTCLSGLFLQHNTVVYVTVRGFNAAGKSITATSNGVTVDLLPPAAFAAFDGVVAVGDYGNAAMDSDLLAVPFRTVGCHWAASSAAVSGIARYAVAVGTQANPTSVVTWTDVGAARGWSTTLPNPLPGGRYVCSVRATSNAGLTTTATADGFSVDTT